jgi:hypothetical protein
MLRAGMNVRIVSGTTYLLDYDAENRLETVTGGGVNASFVYDGDGNRVKGTVGGVTTYYIGNYYEWTGSTSTARKYYYAGALRVAMRTGTSSPNFWLGDHGLDGQDTFYVLTVQQGNALSRYRKENLRP